MFYLYLDESGDLGFDFVNKSPSKFFTICILATRHRESFLKISRAIQKTLRRKLNKPRKSDVFELKGRNTSFEVKQYFWRQIRDCNFGIYAITLDKRRSYERLIKEKERIYNFMARRVIDQISFDRATTRIQVVIDKCKSKPEIIEFDSYFLYQLKGKIDPKIPINIDHLSSQADAFLQATDLFAWGIFRKYEKRDLKWYDLFKEKIMYDKPYK